jgi:PhnB protein
VKQKFSDTPYGDDLPENEKYRIMHISMEIAPGYSLMATDILPSKGQELQPGNNQQISLS